MSSCRNSRPLPRATAWRSSASWPGGRTPAVPTSCSEGPRPSATGWPTSISISRASSTAGEIPSVVSPPSTAEAPRPSWPRSEAPDCPRASGSPATVWAERWPRCARPTCGPPSTPARRSMRSPLPISLFLATPQPGSRPSSASPRRSRSGRPDRRALVRAPGQSSRAFSPAPVTLTVTQPSQWPLPRAPRLAAPRRADLVRPAFAPPRLWMAYPPRRAPCR
jgi:hypothetical protein